MSFGSMADELTGIVEKLPYDYAKKLINRARADVYRASLWSFLLFDGNWTAPATINAGTASVTQGVNQIVLDATASAAVLAVALTPPSSLIQQQFRVGIGTIYNIWDFAIDTGTNIVTLTLDRNYQEATAAATAYLIFQCYYASPVADGIRQWLSVRDMVNWNDLITTKSRAWIDLRDPQRSIFYIPTHVVPYQIDNNPGSPTFKYQLFELWGAPLYQLTYQIWGIRQGAAFVSPSDTVPSPLTDDIVLERAKMRTFEWAEANRDTLGLRMAAFRGLKSDASLEYRKLLIEYRRQDRELVNNYVSSVRRGGAWPSTEGWYSSIAGYANPGPAFG